MKRRNSEKITRELLAMRLMAWERAKAELQSVLHTYFDEAENYNDLSHAIDDFAEIVEEFVG